ncbi:MAG: hypothetical protein IPL39_10515 [Opitutaceae bacterium]|nr:hypothetical protein [Opitutaceae bacterium]
MQVGEGHEGEAVTLGRQAGETHLVFDNHRRALALDEGDEGQHQARQRGPAADLRGETRQQPTAEGEDIGREQGDKQQEEHADPSGADAFQRKGEGVQPLGQEQAGGGKAQPEQNQQRAQCSRRQVRGHPRHSGEPPADVGVQQ